MARASESKSTSTKPISMNKLARMMKDEVGELGVVLTKETAAHFTEIAKRTVLDELKAARANGNGKSVARPLRAAASRAAEATSADVTDELEKGGPAFGGFLKSVGLAVAESQKKLDETFRDTADFLSTQEINTIAVYEQQLKDEDGTMDKGNPVLQKLPLINFFMPTAYQWSRVFLQADMKVSEFNTANGFNIQGKSQSVGVTAKASFGVGGFGGGGSASFSNSSFSSSGEVSTSRDEAAGSFHMDATHEPRPDLQPPRPLILQKGPRLLVNLSAPIDIHQDDDVAKPIIGRRVNLLCELKTTKGDPNTGKDIEASVNNPALYLTPTAKTDATDGKATLTVERKGAAFDAKKPPEAVLARVWFGLATRDIAFNI